MKKADRPRYWVTFLFKDLGLGSTFKPDALHLTVIPWFVTELTEEEVIKSFKLRFAGKKQFDIKIGKIHQFQNGHRVSVNLVQPLRRLKALHKETLDWMLELGGRWAVKNPYVGKDYEPHIRRRRGYNYSEADHIQLNEIVLVKAHRRGDDLRTVIAKENLAGKR